MATRRIKTSNTSTDLATTAKAAAKSSAKRKTSTRRAPVKATTRRKGRTLYATDRTPQGNRLFAYTLAAMRTLGMNTGKAVPVKSLTAFYGSRAIVNHHVKRGNFKLADSKVSLTDAGKQYFAGRLDGSRMDQVINDGMVKDCEAFIKTGKPSNVLAGFKSRAIEV